MWSCSAQALRESRIIVVQVEQCWAGGDKYHFRLSAPDGRRVRLGGEKWNRSKASEALDLIEIEFGVCRRNVRFKVK